MNIKTIELHRRRYVHTWRNAVLKISLTTDYIRNKKDGVLKWASFFFIIKTNNQMTWFHIFYFYCCSDVVRILRNKRHNTARGNMIQVYWQSWFVIAQADTEADYQSMLQHVSSRCLVDTPVDTPARVPHVSSRYPVDAPVSSRKPLKPRKSVAIKYKI